MASAAALCKTLLMQEPPSFFMYILFLKLINLSIKLLNCNTDIFTMNHIEPLTNKHVITPTYFCPLYLEFRGMLATR